MTTLDPGGATWQVFLSEQFGFCRSDPAEIAEELADSDSDYTTINLVRGSALPTDRDGGLRLPGTWSSRDLYELSLDDYETPQERAEAWKLAQAAAWGMSNPDASEEVLRLRSDYEARGNVIESLKREVTSVSLVARRTADENDKLKAEVDRLNSWAGLMSVLDKHYPPDVIGGNSRDPGARHVVLVRKLDQLGIELEAAREENQRLHARVDELDGVEQELAEARRITESAERHAYSADKWRADTEADLARVNLELARLRALKHTTNLEMFDEIAALKAERAQIEQAYQHDKVIVQAAERWRAEMPSGPLPDVYADFEIALAAAVDGRAVDALGTDAATSNPNEPKLTDLVGIDPNFTDGLDTKEYLRQLWAGPDAPVRTGQGGEGRG